MAIYTRTGDAGQTRLSDNSVAHKTDARVEAYGTVDELNSAIGVLLANFDIDDALLDLRDVRDPLAAVERWLLPAALTTARRDVVFDFADGRVFVLRPSQRWRFWRKPLAFPS